MIGVNKCRLRLGHPMLRRRALDVGEMSGAVDKDMGKSGAAGDGENSFQIGRAKSDVTQCPGDDMLRNAVSTIRMRNTIDGLYMTPGRDAYRDAAQWGAVIVELQGGRISHSLL